MRPGQTRGSDFQDKYTAEHGRHRPCVLSISLWPQVSKGVCIITLFFPLHCDNITVKHQ